MPLQSFDTWVKWVPEAHIYESSGDQEAPFMIRVERKAGELLKEPEKAQAGKVI